LKSNKENALELAKRTSVELLEETKSLQEALENCKVIAKLVEISKENEWLALEINGYLIKYKTRDELYQNLPSYRRTSWKFYDLYGNAINLPRDMIDLFGKSIVYHSIQELESKRQITIDGKFLDNFNKFILEHGIDQISKSLKINEARISVDEINHVLEGIKKRIQEFLDVIIALLDV
jgi:AbiTii-like protein